MGWALLVVGIVVFLLGNVGARTGWVLLPFDRHHFYSQLGGAVVAAAGLALTGRR